MLSGKDILIYTRDKLVFSRLHQVKHRLVPHNLPHIHAHCRLMLVECVLHHRQCTTTILLTDNVRHERIMDAMAIQIAFKHSNNVNRRAQVVEYNRFEL
jgi:hypothetical protein